jgi:hypothetical protein
MTAVTKHEHEDPHVGGAGGAESASAPDDASRGNDDESVGSGDVEIPLGVPMGEEELRRLKEAARRPGRGGAGEVTEQEDEGRDDRAQEGSP